MSATGRKLDAAPAKAAQPFGNERTPVKENCFIGRRVLQDARYRLDESDDSDMVVFPVVLCISDVD